MAMVNAVDDCLIDMRIRFGAESGRISAGVGTVYSGTLINHIRGNVDDDGLAEMHGTIDWTPNDMKLGRMSERSKRKRIALKKQCTASYINSERPWGNPSGIMTTTVYADSLVTVHKTKIVNETDIDEGGGGGVGEVVRHRTGAGT